METRPGGALARRPLHFFWICDCSKSMQARGKMQALNAAIHEAIQPMRAASESNPNADVLVRVLKFATGASWQLSQPTPVHDFNWTDLEAEEGLTDMGKALSMVAEQLRVDVMPERALPPVLALVTDGLPTDDFSGGLRKLMDERWARKSVRVAIGIGDDADLEVLERFIGNPEIPPLRANNPDALIRYIRWVSTAVVGSASQPRNSAQDAGVEGMPGGAAGTDSPVPPSTAPVSIPVPIPLAPQGGDQAGGTSDVW
jgi:uncharacterized protein YegL